MVADDKQQPFAEQLVEVFGRKVRQPPPLQPAAAGGGGGGDTIARGAAAAGAAAATAAAAAAAGTSSSSDDDGDDEDGGRSFIVDDAEDGDAEDVESCPQGCDEAVFARVVELRTARLCAIDAAAAASKAADGLGKEHETLVKKAMLVEQSLGAINQVSDDCCCCCVEGCWGWW